jgi:hypothetical protein
MGKLMNVANVKKFVSKHKANTTAKVASLKKNVSAMKSEVGQKKFGLRKMPRVKYGE